ncbi:peptidylprolyl isomerase [Desulfovibrio ferrophilus]|uniref:peptidylprolyl isomerase n=1 Tax=Desulfovibrio ferrophilus TaxID=241368 RepID=UPI003B8328DF
MTCSAKHILVETEEACLDLKKQIEEGTSFDDAAKQNSKCPSGQRGGDLGQFQPGMMVAEFDKVCFTEEVGKVHGPIQTQFGYHLILITERNGKAE